MKTKKVKAAGRFGVRYGRFVRTKIAEIESVQRKKQHCSFCNGVAKRIAKGIWQCKKCGKKFTGHVYFLKSDEQTQALIKKGEQ
jgi:large subunit ribosomal protein L37Ae